MAPNKTMCLAMNSLILGLENEGWFDPYLLLSAFKRKVLSMGVTYISGEIMGLSISDKSVKHVKVWVLSLFLQYLL